MSNSRSAFILTFEPALPDDSKLGDFCSSLFDVRKLATVGRVEKAAREVVLVIGSQRNAEMLESDNLWYMDHKIQVSKSTLEKAEERIKLNKTKLYIGGIPAGVDNVRLWKHFAKYGTLDYTYLIKPGNLRGQKGFGFVIYEDRTGLEKAILAKHYLEGHRVSCQEFTNKPSKTSVEKTFLKNEVQPQTYSNDTRIESIQKASKEEMNKNQTNSTEEGSNDSSDINHNTYANSFSNYNYKKPQLDFSQQQNTTAQPFQSYRRQAKCVNQDFYQTENYYYQASPEEADFYNCDLYENQAFLNSNYSEHPYEVCPTFTSSHQSQRYPIQKTKPHNGSRGQPQTVHSQRGVQPNSVKHKESQSSIKYQTEELADEYVEKLSGVRGRRNGWY